MKHRKIWLILLLCLCIATLAGLGIFIFRTSKETSRGMDRAMGLLDDLDHQLSGKQTGETAAEGKPSETGKESAASSPASESASESDTPVSLQESEALSESRISSAGEEPPEEETDSSTAAKLLSVPEDHLVIFVGDSRTVGMGRAEEKRGDDCIYIGESGEGYRWFTEEGLDQMDEAIRLYPDAPVIFNLGVNDCDLIEEYIEVYREIEKAYSDTEFYYLSVNPVTEESPHVPLSDVLSFNRQLRAAFPDAYIDSCSWMLEGGFEDVDGVHYSGDQYCAIHNYAVHEVYAGAD